MNKTSVESILPPAQIGEEKRDERKRETDLAVEISLKLRRESRSSSNSTLRLCRCIPSKTPTSCIMRQRRFPSSHSIPATIQAPRYRCRTSRISGPWTSSIPLFIQRQATLPANTFFTAPVKRHTVDRFHFPFFFFLSFQDMRD